MKVIYSRHAILDSMPDEKISKHEVEETLRKAELRQKVSPIKFKFSYKDLEVVCIKKQGVWFVITCYRLRA